VATPTVDESRWCSASKTPCDETAAALVLGGYDVVSNVVSTQVDLHSDFGGVPEIASRAHLDVAQSGDRQGDRRGGHRRRAIDAVACTVGPGLIGAAAGRGVGGKGLAMRGTCRSSASITWRRISTRVVEIRHCEFPLLVMLVSGGHTMLVEMQDHGRLPAGGQNDATTLGR